MALTSTKPISGAQSKFLSLKNNVLRQWFPELTQIRGGETVSLSMENPLSEILSGWVWVESTTVVARGWGGGEFAYRGPAYVKVMGLFPILHVVFGYTTQCICLNSRITEQRKSECYRCLLNNKF